MFKLEVNYIDNTSISRVPVYYILMDKDNNVISKDYSINGYIKYNLCKNKLYKLKVKKCTYERIIPIYLNQDMFITLCQNEIQYHFITVYLMDRLYPNLKVLKGEMKLWPNHIQLH